MSEIKPCPFCGGVGKLVQHRIAEDAMEAYVYCFECDVHGVHVEDAYARSDDAIALWNRRSNEAALTASLNLASDACASVQRERDALIEVLADIAKVCEDRIQDGIEMGASVWRIALVDISTEIRAFLARYEGAKG